MSRFPFSRRNVLTSALAVPFLPEIGFGQSDARPVITVAVQSIANTNTLEIAHEASNVGQRNYRLFKEPLIDTDWTGDMSLKPGLAESWRRIDDRTLEFKLRRGVKFHNGDEMTAEDVVFSIGPERLFGSAEELELTKKDPKAPRDPKWPPASVRVSSRAAYPGFERFEVVDRYTVRYLNSIPDITLEGKLSHRVACVVSARAFREAENWTSWARKPVGTGPYRIREFKPDTHLIVDAFDEYWGGRPPIKTIRYIQVPEVASRINGLLSGEYDFACDIPPDQIPAIERNPRYHVVGGLILNQRYVAFDTKHPALKDPRIRLAMSHAVDRQTIVDTLWAGRTEIGRGFQFPFFGRMYIEDWASPAYDPSKAKQLLLDAKYDGSPIEYRILNNYYTNQVATAQILVEMWRSVGLNVVLRIVENSQQVMATDTPRALRDISTTAFYSDPVSNFPVVFGREGTAGRSKEYANEEAFRLIDAIDKSTDIEQRRKDFRRVLEIIERDDPAAILLHQTGNYIGKRKDILWKPSKTFVMDFRSTNFALATP